MRSEGVEKRSRCEDSYRLTGCIELCIGKKDEFMKIFIHHIIVIAVVIK